MGYQILLLTILSLCPLFQFMLCHAFYLPKSFTWNNFNNFLPLILDIVNKRIIITTVTSFDDGAHDSYIKKIKRITCNLILFSSNNIFTANGDLWRDYRNLCNPAFQSASVKTYTKCIQYYVEHSCSYIEEKSKTGESFDVL